MKFGGIMATDAMKKQEDKRVKDLSKTTFLPRGPIVTCTASARPLTPLSNCWRASQLVTSILTNIDSMVPNNCSRLRVQRHHM